MSRLAHGLGAAFAVSLAAHLVLLAGRWPGDGPSAAKAAPTTVLVARLIDGPPTADPASLAPPAAAALPEVSDPTVAPAAVVVEAAPPTPLPALPAVSPPAATGPAEPAAAQATPIARALPLGEPASSPSTASAESRSLGLDRSPQPLEDFNTVLPSNAGQRGGSITVRLMISEHGVVEQVSLLRSSSPGLVDEATLAALNRVRFAPGLRGGSPVRSEVVYEIDFAATSTGGDASGRKY